MEGGVCVVPKGVPNGKRRTSEATKRLILDGIASGHTIVEACRLAGRSAATYERYRRIDPQFSLEVDRLRLAAREGFTPGQMDPGTFEEFSQQYLFQQVFPHMLNVVDLIEGRDPRWIPDAMTFERNEPDLGIVNMPPEHGKSTTLTVNYVTYRIIKDPDVRIIIISKTKDLARKFLRAIKDRLTHPRYAELQRAFGPPGGYKGDTWSQDMIYLSAEARGGGDPHPTVEARGIRSHIYGSRADLIIMDDCVDMTNAHEHAKQIDWIQSEVLSRISASGMCLVVGTRLAPRDLYVELRNPQLYPDEQNPWTYLSMPAVLRFTEDPEDWETLWPRSNEPEAGAKGDMLVAGDDGLYPKWDGKRLWRKRARMSPVTWARVYQQQQVAEDTVFDPDAVRAAVNGNRLTGPIPRGQNGNRLNGMEGLVVVAGLDPAMAGHTAAVCIGLDPQTQKRYVLDVSNRQAMTPDQIRTLIADWTGKYGIAEWRIEKNAFQSMLTQDREVRESIASYGAVLREHFTGANKWDSDFGVASMSTLFAGWEDNRQLIELPSTYRSEGVKSLIEQLVTWMPDVPKGHKTDCVMALWFAELACRDRVQAFSAFGKGHLRNKWSTPWDKSRQATVNLYDAEAAMWQNVV